MALSKSAVEAEERLSMIVDDSLTYLSCSDAPAISREIPAVLMRADFNSAFRAQRIAEGLPVLLQDHEMPKSWDSAIMMIGSRQLNKAARYEIGRTRSLKLAEKLSLKRVGLIRSPLDRIVKSWQFTLLDDGRHVTKSNLYREDQNDPSNPFVPISGGHVPTGQKKYRVTPDGNTYTCEVENGGEDSLMPSLCQTMVCICRHVWQVVLSQKDSAKMSFVTDATGVKGFFRLREIPEGRTRRVALLHWVKDHWRASRNDPDDEIKVRAHLRGRETFDWFGFTGSVIVPESVSAKLEQA